MQIRNYKVRESNAELLRIICIIIILLHHFCVHALYPEVLRQTVNDYSWDSKTLLFFHSFLFIGVNCFILISGWYGIKTKWKSFVHLYFIYSFYSMIRLIKQTVGFCWRGEIYDITYSVDDIILQIFFPFSHGGLWFLDCYLALFLISPLLNAAVENMNKRMFVYVLGLLTILNLYFGYFWGMELINNNGFTVAHFIYLYLVGRYLYKYSRESVNNLRWYNLCFYVMFGVLWGGITLSNAYVNPMDLYSHHWNTFTYNNPILLLTSIFFFMFIMSWHFYSKTINWLAESTLGIYILNEMVIRYSFIIPYAHKFSPVLQLILWFIVSVSFYIFAMLIDKIRGLLCDPIEKWVHKFITPSIRKVVVIFSAKIFND